MKKVLAVIPARMGSSRFPGKPLAELCGRTMLEHVYRRVTMSELVSKTVIATCDQEIVEASKRFGAPVVMTSSRHERASDRVAEAAQHSDAEIVVLVQGDEPMTVPEAVDDAIRPMIKNPQTQCINLAKRIDSEAEFLDPNTIKVVMNQMGDALYFSRAPIPKPVRIPFESLPVYKQVCIIPFRRRALEEFARLEPTPLEIVESIDMLRFLEHGRSVRLVETKFETHAVDTPEDLIYVSRVMKDDPLFSRYIT